MRDLLMLGLGALLCIASQYLIGRLLGQTGSNSRVKIREHSSAILTRGK